MKQLLAIASVIASMVSIAPAQTVVIREGDECRYFRGLSAPPADWAALDFDPVQAGWEVGPTGIGYGDNDDATVLDDMINRYLSVFLRMSFEVGKGGERSAWTLLVRYDDGFVVFIDGVEVARRGLIGDPAPFDEAANPAHEILKPTGFDEAIALDGVGRLFTAGRHVLAAQVHNSGLGSSDLSFAAELSYQPFHVSGVEPAFGPLEGQNEVAVRGAGFDPQDPPAVSFGAQRSPNVTVASPEELRAVAPAVAEAGLVPLEIEDSRGKLVVPDAYRYAAPAQIGLAFDGFQLATAPRHGDVSDRGTFEVWFRRSPDALNQPRVLAAVEAPAGGNAFRIEVLGNQVRARTWVMGRAVNLEASAGVGENQWRHLAFTFSPGGRKLYLDGGRIAGDSLAMGLAPGTRLRLGDGFGAAYPFLGVVESARIWSVERSEGDIRKYRFASLAEGQGLEAAWPLGEASGPAGGDLGPKKLPLVLGETLEAEDVDPAWALIEDFPALAITAVEPGQGPLAGGGPVEVYGAGFSAGRPPTVRFGPTSSPSVTVKSSWLLEVAAPRAIAYQRVDVTVQTDEGTATLPGAYLYAPEALYRFVKEGDVWSYHVGTAAPPTGWTSVNFDAAARGWPTGPTGIGFGDDDDATDVSEMLGKNLTLYARAEWDMAAGGNRIDYLRLRVRYDDGFVAYLNGIEVARANLAGRPVRFSDPASGSHEITGGPGTFDDEIDILLRRDRLRVGKNVLAIEVHNSEVSSDDLSLSAELVYSAPGATFRRGDVDRNHAISVTDVVMLLRALFAGQAITCLEAADTDDDGALALNDAIVLLQYLFLQGAAPGAPRLEPAPDLDADNLDCKV